MLSVSKFFHYNTDTSRFEIRDKYLQTLEYYFTVGTAVSDYAYDDNRNLLWLYGTNYVYRVLITETNGVVTGHTLQASVSVTTTSNNYSTYIAGTKLALNYSTGTCYVLNQPTNNSGAMVSYILYNGATVGASLAITSSGLTLAASSAGQGEICVDQSTGNVIVVIMASGGTSGSQIVYVTSNLSTQGSIPVAYQSYFTTSITNLLEYKSDNLYTGNKLGCTGHHDIYYNPHTGAVEIPYCGTANKCLELKWMNGRYYRSLLDLPGSNYNTIVGYKTKNRYYMYNNNLICKDKDGNTIFNITPDATTYTFTMNKFTEEFYRFDETNKKFILYDRWARILNNSATFTSASNRFLFGVLPGSENSVSVGIAPCRIVSPVAGERTSDTTPTVVFSVGTAPETWTQQFTVCMDRTYSTIDTGTDATTYERKASSWANSAYYKDWTWQYSTNYNETTTSGTWSSLGTGNPLRSGGSVPTNGVTCGGQDSVYVRFTVAPADTLSGTNAEDSWYMKIYSYST